MRTRNQNRPFQELGNLLEKYRSARFRSALALFKEAKFSFSYSAYADFERGVTLPGIEALLELLKFFKQDPGEAVVTWARVQMPSAELRKLFIRERRGTSREVAAQAQPQPQPSGDTRPPSFENTWVFGPKERAMLLKDPWLWDIYVSLAIAYPAEVRFGHLPFPKGVSPRQALKKHLRPWISAEHIVESEKGLRLSLPHIHIPQTAEWSAVGKNNVRRAYETLLEKISSDQLAKGEGYRQVVYRPLTEAQKKKWVAALKKLEAELKADSYDAEGEAAVDLTCVLVAMLGQR